MADVVLAGGGAAIGPAVPAAPSLGGLRFKGGPSAQVRFRLGRTATVTLRLTHAGRTVRTLCTSLGAGNRTLVFGRLAAGHFVVVLSAADSAGRTTVVRRKVTQT